MDRVRVVCLGDGVDVWFTVEGEREERGGARLEKVVVINLKGTGQD